MDKKIEALKARIQAVEQIIKSTIDWILEISDNLKKDAGDLQEELDKLLTETEELTKQE